MSSKAYSQLYYHFVWATYERKPLIDLLWEQQMYGYIVSRCKAQGILPLAIGGEETHIHLLLRAWPDMLPAEIAGGIKGSSSHFVNHQCSIHNHFSWQKGYGVFSICSQHIKDVIEYIRNQKQHHCSGTAISEFEEINLIEDLTSDIDVKIPECVTG